MLKLFVSCLLMVAAGAADNGATFDRAKAMADRDEGSLSESQQLALTQSQAPVVQAALSSCLVANGPAPFSFVIVAELDSTGRVVKTWRSEESKLAACFQKVVAKAVLAAPPRTPFYTSFEMTLPQSAIRHQT